MSAFKNRFGYVLKAVKKDKTLKRHFENLEGKTYIISGSSRGIGLNIAKKLGEYGANVTITGKTTKEHPKLEGTIYTALEELQKDTGKDNYIALPCDIRKVDDIDKVIDKTIDKFGGIDGVVLNAGALNLKGTLEQTVKEVQLMNEVNINGTYYFGKKCLEKMHKKNKGQMLIISPPLDMLNNDDWWVNHLYYSMSKFNMSLMGKYWNKEFTNVGVNTLWPRTTINTAPVRNILGGEDMLNISRKVDIMGDAARAILLADPYKCNGKNFIDDEVLVSLDMDVEKYRVNKDIDEKDLMPDFFC